MRPSVAIPRLLWVVVLVKYVPSEGIERGSSWNRQLWYEALRDTLQAAGESVTLHVICAVPALCMQPDLMKTADRPYLLWDASDSRSILDSHACGPDLGIWDLVLLVAHSNSSIVRLIRACRSNKPRYIAAWPYSAAIGLESKLGPGSGPWSPLGLAFSASRLRMVSMDIPLVHTDRPLHFYRIRPYSKQTPCREPVTPQLVATWQRGRGVVGELPLFPLRPPWNLQGCPLSVAIRQYPPYISLRLNSTTEGTPASWEAEGQWVPLLRALEHGLHARFNLTPLLEPSHTENGTLVHTTQSDVYMLRTVKDPLHRNEVPQSSRSSCFTMCVPRRWRQTPLWRALLGEFSGPVWALVLATYLAVYAALLLDTHRAEPSTPTPTRALKQRRIGFDLLAAVFGSVSLSSLGHGHGRSRARWRERCLVAMWLFFSVIMCTAYHAVQHSLRAAPQLEDSLRTLHDLARTDIVVRGPQVAVDHLAAVQGTAPILERLVSYGFSGLVGIRPRADEAYLCSSLERSYLEAVLGRDAEGRLRHVPLEGCIFSIPESFFMLPVGSAYLDKVEDVVLRMTEAGITEHVVSVRDSAQDQPDSLEAGRPRAEDVGHFRPALLLLAVGYGISFTAFLVELLVHGLTKDVRRSGAQGCPDVINWWG